MPEIHPQGARFEGRRGAVRAARESGARGKLSAAAFDAFVTDLVNGRWLEVGDEGEVAYGPRAILELADVLLRARGGGAADSELIVPSYFIGPQRNAP